MLLKNLHRLIILLVALAGISAFVYWMVYNPVEGFTMSVPGMDNRPEKGSETEDEVFIGSKFSEYTTNFQSGLTGKWPHFRGEGFININKEKIKLIDNFGETGPKLMWHVLLGEGHAAPVIFNGRVYILDYDEAKKADALRCFALETGEEIWKRWYNVQVKRNHGMSRTIPAVNDKYIVTIGPRGHVMCANPETGDFHWGIDLVEDYGTEIPFWYTGQCPFIDDDVAVIAPGGSSLLIGVDCSSGNVVWHAPNPDQWNMSHSSVMPMTLNGKKMYVYAAVGGICGISAEEMDRGKMLWKTIEFSPSVVAPSPVVFEDGKIFMTAGYGAGAILFQVIERNGQYNIEVVQKYKPKDGMASEQQTPVVWQGRMFTILPKDAGANRNRFVCCDPVDCTNILWTSGKDQRFGLGPYIVADGKFFILNDDGTLTIATARTDRFEILDQIRIMEGQDAWGPIAIADGYLLMRDSKKMVCLDMRTGVDIK